MPQNANWGLVIDPEALYVALDAHRRAQSCGCGKYLSWRTVAAEIGLAPSTFSRLGIRHGNLHANVLIKLLAWMGQTDLAPYVREVSPPEPATELEHLLPGQPRHGR